MLQNSRKNLRHPGSDRGPTKVRFKCTPEKFAELIECEDIHPAPFVGRYSWVMLHRLDALRTDELERLIRQSYEMADAKAPKPARKVTRKKTPSQKRPANRKARPKKR